VGESIELHDRRCATTPDLAACCRFRCALNRNASTILTAPRDDGTTRGEEEGHKVGPRIVRVRCERRWAPVAAERRQSRPPRLNDRIRPLRLAYTSTSSARLEGRPEIIKHLLLGNNSPGLVTHPACSWQVSCAPAQSHLHGIRLLSPSARSGAEAFYKPAGENVVRSFLLRQLPDGCIKDHVRFGMREHPILGCQCRCTPSSDFRRPRRRHRRSWLAGVGKVAQCGSQTAATELVSLHPPSDVATALPHPVASGPGIGPRTVPPRPGENRLRSGSTGLSNRNRPAFEFIARQRSIRWRRSFPMRRNRLRLMTPSIQRSWPGQYLAQMTKAPVVPPSSGQAQGVHRGQVAQGD